MLMSVGVASFILQWMDLNVLFWVKIVKVGKFNTDGCMKGVGLGSLSLSLFVCSRALLMGIEVKTKLVKILKELFVCIYLIRAWVVWFVIASKYVLQASCWISFGSVFFDLLSMAMDCVLRKLSRSKRTLVLLGQNQS